MIDKGKAYKNQEYEINSKIIIRQPTLGEIIDSGEQKYWSLVRNLCSTPADQKVAIWDTRHIYWDEMDEFELFIGIFLSLCQSEDMSIIFPNIDIKTFNVEPNYKTMEVNLYNDDGVLIDRSIHALVTEYLRFIHCFVKNCDVGYDTQTKDVMIEDDRDDMAKLASKPFESVLIPLVVSMTNCQEFKYRYDDVWNLPIGAFMQAVHQVNHSKHYDNLMRGIYNGCVDIKKINKKELNWMGELK